MTVDRRFRGPPDSANGGYACGLVAGQIDGPAEVTLRRPIPLETELSFKWSGEIVSLRHGDLTVAEGRRTTLEMPVPEPVSFEDARAAVDGYDGFQRHPYPMCFVCGPDREEDDGLRVFPGPVQGRRLVAAPWVPGTSVCDEAAIARPECIWAALDCPTWFGARIGETPSGVPLLGRLAGEIESRPRSGDRCVLIGWPLRTEGRKVFCAAALLSENGRTLARARATWITAQ